MSSTNAQTQNRKGADVRMRKISVAQTYPGRARFHRNGRARSGSTKGSWDAHTSTRGLPNAYTTAPAAECGTAGELRARSEVHRLTNSWLRSEPPESRDEPPLRRRAASPPAARISYRRTRPNESRHVQRCRRWEGPVGLAPLTVKAASSSSKRSSFLIAKSGPCRSAGPVADVMATLLIRAVKSRRPLLLRRSAEGGRARSRRLGATCIAAMAIERSPRRIAWRTAAMPAEPCSVVAFALPFKAGSQTQASRGAARRSARLAAQLRMGSPCT